ncbi:MAG: type II secretion system F family protein [Candidatus Nanohaloarchaeota archaeon QJJ-5]|nr:type II secretion system F family protein [Candidatus Nanohaloarchaeota archaeon QJJ-5]
MGITHRIRAYYHKNKRDILIILLTGIIGLGIIGLNYWNYSSDSQIHRFDQSDVQDPLIMTMTSDREFQTTFGIRNPSELDSMTIEVAFEESEAASSYTFYLNGQAVTEGASSLTSGSVQSLNPDPSLIETSNQLRIEADLTGTGSAEIRSVTVTGFSQTQRVTFLMLNLLGLLIMMGPILSLKYYQYQVKAEIEDRFPDFLRDVVEGTRSGMSLPQAIKNTEGNDYGRMTPHVEKISAKLDWGIPFETVMHDFAEKTDSTIIRRAVNTIIQTYQSGGNVTDVLESVGNNIQEIKELEQERESELYGEMITGYVVYFIFLIVLIALMRYLVPALSFPGDIGPLGNQGMTAAELINTYRPIFRDLVIIQSVFSGLVIGKLSEGELRAGGKHIAILMAVGYTVAVLFM